MCERKPPRSRRDETRRDTPGIQRQSILTPVAGALHAAYCWPACRCYGYALKSTTVTAWLLKQAATFVPAEFQATSKISPSPRCLRNNVPSFTDQIRTELSIEPEQRYWPQGENAIE
jgi:hypothetical protein